MEFCYEKILIEMCIFLREFLSNIGLTSLRPVSMLTYYKILDEKNSTLFSESPKFEMKSQLIFRTHFKKNKKKQ
jgi:hypothetical protein